MSLDEITAMLRFFCDQAGSKSAWAREHGVAPVYVGRVLAGRELPGPKLLTAMGLRRVVSYERIAKEKPE